MVTVVCHYDIGVVGHGLLQPKHVLMRSLLALVSGALRVCFRNIFVTQNAFGVTVVCQYDSGVVGPGLLQPGWAGLLQHGWAGLATDYFEEFARLLRRYDRWGLDRMGFRACMRAHYARSGLRYLLLTASDVQAGHLGFANGEIFEVEATRENRSAALTCQAPAGARGGGWGPVRRLPGQ